jgi:hypothetical protein
MRISEHLAWIPSIASSTAATFKVGWLAGLVVLVVTFVISDIHRAGGLSKWATKLVPAFEKWDEAWSGHARRRGKRKEEALRRARRCADLKRGEPGKRAG